MLSILFLIYVFTLRQDFGRLNEFPKFFHNLKTQNDAVSSDRPFVSVKLPLLNIANEGNSIRWLPSPTDRLMSKKDENLLVGEQKSFIKNLASFYPNDYG